MKYIIKQSADPEIFEFWHHYTTSHGEGKMLCFICHEDCMDSDITSLVREQGSAEVEFNIKG